MPPFAARGIRDTAMFTMLIGVLLNVILAPIFIFGFGWGMRGAALATVLSQGVSAVWVMAYFLRGDSLLENPLEKLAPEKIDLSPDHGHRFVALCHANSRLQ